MTTRDRLAPLLGWPSTHSEMMTRNSTATDLGMAAIGLSDLVNFA